jgi:hypothetical protein
MLAMPGLRVFSLTADAGSEGVSCCANGVFVGGVPLLARKGVGAGSVWSARPFAELNEALSARATGYPLMLVRRLPRWSSWQTPSIETITPLRQLSPYRCSFPIRRRLGNAPKPTQSCSGVLLISTRAEC